MRLGLWRRLQPRIHQSISIISNVPLFSFFVAGLHGIMPVCSDVLCSGWLWYVVDCGTGIAVVAFCLVWCVYCVCVWSAAYWVYCCVVTFLFVAFDLQLCRNGSMTRCESVQ